MVRYLYKPIVYSFWGKYVSSVESFARGEGAVASMRSTVGGRSWALGGTVPLIPNTVEAQYSDPHCVELPDGTLLGLICFQGSPDGSLSGGRVTDYSLVQTRSENRGRQWSMPRSLGFHGTPPHLIHHSSGAIICTYGHRQVPYGQRAMVSYDGGNSWEYDLCFTGRWIRPRSGVSGQRRATRSQYFNGVLPKSRRRARSL